jgi:co-chaperonin GroES (HSP10)
MKILFPIVNDKEEYPIASDYRGPKPERGDKAYINYLVGDEATALPYSKGNYLAEHEQIYCVIRDEEIVMIGDKMLIEPDAVPEEENTAMIGGKLIYVKPPDWEKNEKRANIGTIRHIGSQMRGYDQELKAGDRIIFKDHCDKIYPVEDTDYYVMRQIDAVALIHDNGAISPLSRRIFGKRRDEVKYKDGHAVSDSGLFIGKQNDRTHFIVDCLASNVEDMTAGDVLLTTEGQEFRFTYNGEEVFVYRANDISAHVTQG